MGIGQKIGQKWIETKEFALIEGGDTVRKGECLRPPCKITLGKKMHYCIYHCLIVYVNTVRFFRIQV